tara:strand:+ start:605 stop:742 length:138 start_codon:yes stop_codon:yes gene_type:complete
MICLRLFLDEQLIVVAVFLDAFSFDRKTTNLAPSAFNFNVLRLQF